MKLVSSILFCLAGIVLAIGAFSAGSPAFGLGALAVSALFAASLYFSWGTLVLDSCLTVLSGLCLATIFLNIPVALVLPTVFLGLLGWNSARQFAVIDQAAIAPEALRKHILHYLTYTLVPSAILGGLIGGSFALQVRVTFGIALLLAAAAFVVLFVFLIVSSNRRAKRMGLTKDEYERQLRVATRIR